MYAVLSRTNGKLKIWLEERETWEMLDILGWSPPRHTKEVSAYIGLFSAQWRHRARISVDIPQISATDQGSAFDIPHISATDQGYQH